MDKQRKLDLIQRSLGLRHKMKVHESMKQPETHEEMASMYLTQWEFEDELHAIEDILAEVRQKNVEEKRQRLLKSGVTKDSGPIVAQDEDDLPKKKKK